MTQKVVFKLAKEFGVKTAPELVFKMAQELGEEMTKKAVLEMAREAGSEIWRLPVVKRVTGLSDSTIRRKMENGTFPKALKLGDRAIGFKSDLVLMWLNDLKTA